MSDRKNQHYVPQFYLRNFSVAASDKLVSLYHVPSDRHVPTAPIRTQASEDYYYKELALEAALGDIEGPAAGVIGRAIKAGEVPSQFSENHHVLLVFTLFQAMRTPAAVDEMTEALNMMVRRLAAEGLPELAEEAQELEVRMDNPAGFLLSIAAQNYPLALDLRMKVLVNKTGTPFITSDHPAVMYNQFLEARKGGGSNRGIAVKGLQIFLPLGPSHMLVLFDGSVYKVGGMKLSATRVEVTEKSDVDSLNLLQAVNADDTLYFNDSVDISYVKRLARRAVRFRKPEKSVMSDHDLINAETGETGEVIRMSRADPRLGLELRCIKVLPSASSKPLDSRAVQLRNPQLHQLFEEFRREAEAGGYKSTHFGKWIRDKFGSSEPK